jgi:uncharacterized membrane protein
MPLRHLLPKHVRARPGLWISLATTLVATAALGAEIRFSKAVLIGWCCGAALYLALAVRTASRGTIESMRRRAEMFDQGSGFIFFVTVFAALASIAAIVFDLSHAKEEGAAVLILSAATLLLSWLFVHTVFAFHYAHLFYLDPTAITFPGAGHPDYWDFLYFAMVIGMTAQVSDVTTGTPAMRRLVLVHSVIAFFFNTAILALGVNMAASAVGPGS